MTPPLRPNGQGRNVSSFDPILDPSQNQTAPAQASLARKAGRFLFNSGRDIVYGVGDALWGALTFPEKALKYWSGVDRHLGQNRAWSFQNFGQHLDGSLQGNPLFRVGDTAAHIFYGAINTFTAGIPHQIFNEGLGLRIEYFAPPPKTLREISQWVSQGVLTALPLRGPVGKAVAHRIAKNISHEASPAAAESGKISFVDWSPPARNNLPHSSLAQSLPAWKPNPKFGYYMSQGSESSTGGLRIVEGKAERAFLETETASLKSAEVLPEMRMVYDSANDALVRVQSQKGENAPQSFPNGLPSEAFRDPGVDPTSDVMLLPGIEPKPETIGDPLGGSEAKRMPGLAGETLWANASGLAENFKGLQEFSELLAQAYSWDGRELQKFLEKVRLSSETVSGYDLRELFSSLLAPVDEASPITEPSQALRDGFSLMPYLLDTLFEAEGGSGPWSREQILEKLSDPRLLRGVYRIELYRALANRPAIDSSEQLSSLLAALKESALDLSEAGFSVSEAVGRTLFAMVNHAQFYEDQSFFPALDLLAHTQMRDGRPSFWTKLVLMEILHNQRQWTDRGLSRFMETIHKLGATPNNQRQYFELISDPEIFPADLVPTTRAEMLRRLSRDWGIPYQTPERIDVTRVSSREEQIHQTMAKMLELRNDQSGYIRWRNLLEREAAPHWSMALDLFHFALEGNNNAVRMLVKIAPNSRVARDGLVQLILQSDSQLRIEAISQVGSAIQRGWEGGYRILGMAAEIEQEAVSELLNLGENGHPQAYRVLVDSALRAVKRNPNAQAFPHIVVHLQESAQNGHEAAVLALYDLALQGHVLPGEMLLGLVQTLRPDVDWKDIRHDELLDPTILHVLRHYSVSYIRAQNDDPFSFGGFGPGGMALAGLAPAFPLVAGLAADSGFQAATSSEISLWTGLSLALFGMAAVGKGGNIWKSLKRWLNFETAEPEPTSNTTSPVRQDTQVEPVAMRMIRNLISPNPKMTLTMERRVELWELLEELQTKPETPFPDWLWDLTYRGEISGGFTVFLLPDVPRHRELGSAQAMQILRIEQEGQVLHLQTPHGVAPVRTLQYRSEVGRLPFVEGEQVLMLAQSGGGIGTREGFHHWLSGLRSQSTSHSSHPFRNSAGFSRTFDPGRILNSFRDYPQNIHEAISGLGILARHPEFREFSWLRAEILASNATPEIKVRALADMAMNKNFDDFEAVFTEILFLPADPDAKARAIVRATKNEKFLEFRRAIQILDDLPIDKNLFDMHFADLATHPNFLELRAFFIAVNVRGFSENQLLMILAKVVQNPRVNNFEEIDRWIGATNRHYNHNLRVEAQGFAAANLNYRDLDAQKKRILESNASSSVKLLAFARLASHPDYRDFGEFYRLAPTFFSTDECIAEALGIMGSNPNLEDFDKHLLQMEKTEAYPFGMAKALRQLLKNPRLPSRYYENIMDRIYRGSSEEFLRALTIPHPAQREYLSKFLSNHP